MTTAGRDSAGRPHSLAPAHLGEVRAGAALAIAVLGMALFISAIGLVVAGLTVSAGYDADNLPPNVVELGRWQLVAGIGLFVVGAILVGGAIGLLSGGVRARIPIAVLAILTAVGALAGGVLIIASGPSDLILAISLFGLALGLGGAGLLLLRPR